jgi:hypothetical protein
MHDPARLQFNDEEVVERFDICKPLRFCFSTYLEAITQETFEGQCGEADFHGRVVQ